MQTPGVSEPTCLHAHNHHVMLSARRGHRKQSECRSEETCRIPLSLLCSSILLTSFKMEVEAKTCSNFSGRRGKWTCSSAETPLMSQMGLRRVLKMDPAGGSKCVSVSVSGRVPQWTACSLSDSRNESGLHGNHQRSLACEQRQNPRLFFPHRRCVSLRRPMFVCLKVANCSKSRGSYQWG